MVEIQILQGLRDRDEAAFTALSDLYLRYIGAVVSKVADGRLTKEDIEELCSDVLFKIWQKAFDIELYRGSMKAYIGVTARNMTLNALRSIRKIAFEELREETLFSGTTEEVYLLKENVAGLRSLIDKMEEPDKEIFIRRYLYLERVKDIAKQKGLNEKTVSAKLSRARSKLQKCLAQDS